MIGDRNGLALMGAQEPRGEKMQIGLAVTKRLQGLYRFDDVIAIGPGTSMALPYQMDAFM